MRERFVLSPLARRMIRWEPFLPWDRWPECAAMRLPDQAACSDDPFDDLVKCGVGSFISYELMIRGQVSR